jgi:type I restriction enzyme S subunit
VEAVLAKVRAARERLNRVPAILKRFRQSVLSAACSGRLTADWRAQNPNAEPANLLLARITAERAASGQKKGIEEESNNLEFQTPEVPESWVPARVEELLHYVRSAGYGVLQPGEDLRDGVPMVRVCDIENGTVRVDELKRIAPHIDSQYARTRLEGGEVLVTLVGTIGRVGVAPQSVRGANIARAVAMLPLCPHALADYLHFALTEPGKNLELNELAREVARKTLNLGLLKAVRVPLPPLAEQREIVARVSALFARADAIDARLTAARSAADRLTQAVLAKAFRGELVPTEAELARRENRTYEPASELLARVRAAREQPAAPKPARKRKPKPNAT